MRNPSYSLIVVAIYVGEGGLAALCSRGIKAGLCISVVNIKGQRNDKQLKMERKRLGGTYIVVHLGVGDSTPEEMALDSPPEQQNKMARSLLSNKQ